MGIATDPRECILRILTVFSDLKIAHMLTGSLASNSYGKVRASKDADFVVDMPAIDVDAIETRIRPIMTIDRQMSFETLTLTSRWKLQAARGGFEIELFLLRDDEYDRLRFQRRVALTYEGVATWAPTAEDVVVQKLRWAIRGRRAKDIEDARNVIAVQGIAMDWPYIRRWCDAHGSRALLEELRTAARVDA